MENIHEYRTYNDNGDTLIALWETLHIVKQNRLLIKDREGHAEVDLYWLLTATTPANPANVTFTGEYKE